VNILVFNCGSSSLNYKIFEANGGTFTATAWGKAHRVGVKGTAAAFMEYHSGQENLREEIPLPDHRTAAALVLAHLRQAGVRFGAIGHRFVHGGSHFQESALLTTESLGQLERCLPLAPIHNPNSMSVIRECLSQLSEIPQYVTFDTAFHATLPIEATTYALPPEIRQRFGFRKYGFHGLSYVYVVQEAARLMQQPLAELRIVACHLGTGGSSVAAIQGGFSMDTTMGYSPLPGLLMSTRTGDLDPLIPVLLMENYGYTPEQLTDLMNKESGLLGLSGVSSDLRDLIARMDGEGDARARLAFEVYAYRLKKAIGSFVAVLGGLDLLIFTDDIGAQNWRVREQASSGMEWCGIVLDREANRRATGDRPAFVDAAASPARVLAMPTDEELVIGREGLRWAEEIHAAF